MNIPEEKKEMLRELQMLAKMRTSWYVTKDGPISRPQAEANELKAEESRQHARQQIERYSQEREGCGANLRAGSQGELLTPARTADFRQGGADPVALDVRQVPK